MRYRDKVTDRQMYRQIDGRPANQSDMQTEDRGRQIDTPLKILKNKTNILSLAKN